MVTRRQAYRHLTLGIAVLVMGMALVLACGPPCGAAFDKIPYPVYNPRVAPRYAPNQVLVTLRAGKPESALYPLLQEYKDIQGNSATIARRPKYSRTYAINLPAGVTAEQVVGAKSRIMQRYSAFEHVEYNLYRYPLVTPNDEFYPSAPDPMMTGFLDGQWQLQPGEHIYAPEAWDLQKGSDRIIVAVIDTGVRDREKYDSGKLIRIIHPDLQGRVAGGWDIADQEQDEDNPGPAPSESTNPIYSGTATHGTHVAGIIAAQADNWIGIAGLCWDNVWIWPLKVAKDSNLEILEVDVIEAIYYCIYTRFSYSVYPDEMFRVNVINLSLGGLYPSDAEQSAIRQAVTSGIIVCASAGNEWGFGPYAPGYPASYDEVICVGATDYDDLAAVFSNRGRAMDITAPGWWVLSTLWDIHYATVDTETDDPQEPPPTQSVQSSTWPVPDPMPTWPDKYGNSFAWMSGTSQASPHVAAAAALLLSHGVPVADVKEILYQSATPKGMGRPNDTYGWGVLNIGAALKMASIDVKIASPGKGSVVSTTRPRFRIDLRHARKDSIRVWIDGLDTNGDGVPDSQPTLGGTTPEIPDWEKYLYPLDAAAGKSYLLFEYAVNPQRAVNGLHKVYVSAESDINFDIPPPAPLIDSDDAQFRTEAQNLGSGWRLFSVPYEFEQPQKPEDILGSVGLLARWNYATNPYGEYAMYSLDRTRTDEEATFTPSGAYISSLVHPIGDTNSSPPAGLGYWLYLPSTAQVQLPEGAGRTISEAPYEISLYYGWDMVGNPFTFPVAWSNVMVEYAGTRLTAEEAVAAGWISNSFFRYDPVYRRYTFKNVASAVMLPWEAQWVKVKVRTPELAPRLPDAWSDEFNDGVLDMMEPEPDWFVGTTYGSVTEAGGMLSMIGTSGQASYIYATDSDFPIYRNFAIETKLYLADAGPTLAGGPSSAEIRFRRLGPDDTEEICSLSFMAGDVPNVICLRRSDSRAVIQSKQVNYNLGSGTVLYATIVCVDTHMKIRVGTLPGQANVADWELTDSTFMLPGSFRLVSDGMLDCRWDYFRYRPLVMRPPDIKIIVPPNAYTGTVQ